MKRTVFLLVANLVCATVNTSLALVFVRPASNVMFVEGCMVGLNLLGAFLLAWKLHMEVALKYGRVAGGSGRDVRYPSAE